MGQGTRLGTPTPLLDTKAINFDHDTYYAKPYMSLPNERYPKPCTLIKYCSSFNGLLNLSCNCA